MSGRPPLTGLRREPWWRHGAYLLLLAAGGWIVYGDWLSVSHPHLPDELAYVRAIRFVLEGESPYEWPGYLYPPLFALAGAELWQRFGREGLLWLLRLGNLTGLVVTVWCAQVWLPWTWRWRLAVGLGVVIFSPAVIQGMTFGNVSLLVSGLLVWSLGAWHRHPWLAGLAMGASVPIKPLAPVAGAVLAGHRPADHLPAEDPPAEAGSETGPRSRLRRRRHWITAGVAGIAALALTVPLPYFQQWLELAERASAQRGVSFHRFPAVLGWEVNHLALTGGVVLGAVAWARWRPLERYELLALALAAVMAGTPLVWSHTLVATLPLQALAVTVFLRRGERAETGGADAARWRLWEGVALALAILACHFAEGATSMYTRPAWQQIAGGLVPALAPPALAAYVLLAGRGRVSGAGERRDRLPAAVAGAGDPPRAAPESSPGGG